MISALWGKVRHVATDRMAWGSAIMAGAIVAGNAISFLSLPLLARLYSPEAFGNFGFVISWTTILGVLFTMRYEAIVPITKSADHAAALTRRAANRMLVWSLLLLVALSILVAAGVSGGEIGSIEIYLGIGAAFAASYFAMGRSVHQRMDKYGIIAASSIIRSAVFVGGALILALAGTAMPGGAALLLASMLSFMVPGLIYHLTSIPAYRTALRPGKALDASSSTGDRAALRKVSLTFVLSQISFQFPLWLAMLLFGSTATGWVTMSYRLAMFPSDILCGSVALVLARKIADSINHHPDRLAADRRLLGWFLIGNFLLFTVLGVAIWLGAGPLLGPQWADAAGIMGMLAAIGLSFTIQPTVIQVLSLMNRESEILAMTIVHVALLLIGAVAVWWTGSSLLTATIGLTVIEILLSIGLTCYALHITRMPLVVNSQPA
jgi:O-antigen/teichoic acid export membrane protein